MSTFYVDTSALAKLVIDEAESVAFNRWIDVRRDAHMVSSALTVTELHRAARRVDGEACTQADRVLTSVHLRRITRAILSEASKLNPVGLRSLDAIHLATALELRGDLDGILTYDDRLAEAAVEHGLDVLAPKT